ncbi:MAG TPA: membrane protease subunit, stomatin/prohibitin, partial [Flavobacteriales bacterium]|nr:membrane protease subunit, stomatin/prohibitin [Flavobacteriales bacterium]
ESEQGTEIALEEKQQQIARKVMETEMVKQEKERRIREMAMAADISVEQEREKLIDMRVQNEHKEADAYGYRLQTALQPLKELDWRTLMAISTQNGDPGMHIALAFRELAENAGRIGTLNITPDLLTSILATKKA